MPPPNSLQKTQQILSALIQEPQGVAAYLKRKPVRLPIAGTPELSAVQRLDIYANMYFFRIRDALYEDFPKVRKCLGDTVSHQLILDYLYKHPSQHWSLRYVGRSLPAFIQKQKKIPSYLADLARLEWAILEAFDGPSAPALTREMLMQKNPKELGRYRFQTIPTLQLMRSWWPLDHLYTHPRQGAAKLKNQACFVVWRQGLEVKFRPCQTLEFRLLQKLNRGSSINQLCLALAEKRSISAEAPMVLNYLNRWLSEDLLRPYGRKTRAGK